MYIKKVIVEGFKSYKNKTVLELFHPSLNIIVGSNGSGKTNILYAIQFVLTDEFYPLQRAVKQSMIFSDSGPRVLTASVEIIFDNTDGRFPNMNNEVSLSRRLGHNSDKVYINNQSSTRKEMKNLLITAGFCSCNPYYIVKQGKVNELATAADSQRLNILLEIAAVQVSEEEIRISRKTLEGSKLKLTTAKKLMDWLNERLKDLETEKNDVEIFNDLNKRKRSLQLCLYESQLEKTNKELEEVNETYIATLREQNECKAAAQHFEEEVEKAASLLENNKKKVEKFHDDCSKLHVEEHQLKNQIKEINLKIKSLQDESTLNTAQGVNIQKKLSNLNKKMECNENKLGQLKKEFDDIVKREERCTNRLLEMKRRREELLDRFGHNRRFFSREERDIWLQNELQSLEILLSEMELKKNQIQTELTKETESVEKEENDLETLKHDLIEQHKMVDETEKSSYSLLEQKIEYQSQLRKMMKEEVDIEQKYTSLMDDLVKTKYKLCLVTDKNIVIGLEGLQKILDESGDQIVQGYYGMLIDIISNHESLNTVVEVIAGKRLFYHIVATEEVSKEITKVFNRNNYQGEINFMLLNQLQYKKYTYPSTRDVLPLITKIECEARYQRATNLVFGKTLLCRNMNIALQFAGEHSLNCITVDGDQALKSGFLSGGYRDESKQTISTYKNFCRLQTELKKAEEEGHKLQEKITELKNKIVKNSNEQEKEKKKIMNAKNNIEELESRKVLLNEKLAGLREVKTKKEKLFRDNQSHIDLLLLSRNTLQHELKEEMADHLSDLEQRTLNELDNEIRNLTEECKNLLNKKLQLQYDKELTLKIIFNKEHEQLTEELEKCNNERTNQMLQPIFTKLEKTECELATVSKQLKDVETKMSQATEETTLLEEDYESKKTDEIKANQNMETSRNEMKLITSKKNTLMKNLEESEENIKHLGTLSELYECREMRTSEVLRELSQLNRRLTMIHSINMQASFQYDQFLEKKHKRQLLYDNLQKEYDAILEMINHLETKRDDAILYSLRQSSENFTKIFSKLVAEGRAELVMQDAEGQPLALRTITDINVIKGVGIKVKFDSSRLEIQHFKELSGSQKSVLAVTLILTLQACSQNPLFVFDEIDSMLDSNYRPKLAQLISEHSSEAQFIMTSHGEEVLHYGNQFFAVTYANKVSHVREVSKEEALQLVVY